MLSTPLRLETDGSAYVPTELSQQKQFDWPIHFRGVVGADKSDTLESGFAGDSWCNLQEAEAVTEIIVNLAFDQGVPVDKIGVMVSRRMALSFIITSSFYKLMCKILSERSNDQAPFRGQVSLLRRLLRTKQLGGINVGECYHCPYLLHLLPVFFFLKFYATGSRFHRRLPGSRARCYCAEFNS